MNINKLLNSSMQELADLMHYDENELPLQDVRPILTNICRNIASLQRRIDSLENETFNLEDKYIG